MPELPEVETIARGLCRLITGLVIESVHLSRSDIVHGEATPMCRSRKRRIQRVNRVGKQVQIELTKGVYLFVHLGMTGRLTVVDRDRPIEPHTHLRIKFRRRRAELRFCDPRRFGGIWVITKSTDRTNNWIGRKPAQPGADPLELSYSDLWTLLRRQRQIKALLLDQQPISGIGNIYCDEALHRASINPRTLASDLDEAAVRRLKQALHRVLNEAIRAGGSSISDYRTPDNSRGTFQVRHRVYNRAGQPCRRCGTAIQRLIVAGRGTFICPQCQQKTGTRKAGKTRKHKS